MFKNISNAPLIEASLRYKDKSKTYAFKPIKWALLLLATILALFIIITTVSITTPLLSKIGIVGGIMSRHKFVNNVMGTSDEARQSALWQYYTNNGRDSVVTRENLIKAINSLDSLETEVVLWRVYNDNISQILAGTKSGITSDSALMSTISKVKGKTEITSHLDTLLRKKVVADIEVKNRLNRRGEFQNMFRPVMGKIIKPFNRKTNKDIIIAVVGAEPVYAISGGTVLFTTWSPYYGYLVQIQHGAGIISLYSNISQLMVKEGSVVGAGAIIGYVGGDKEMKQDTTATAIGGDNKYLRFSMWHEGNAVDPETYILF
ncbi:MAG: M23 family metallopeptidase [Rikenellaceae bacterium]